MTRVIALGPGGRPQAPVRDDRYGSVIHVVRQAGMLGRPLLSPVCKDRDQADDVRRGIYRSARYYCSCGDSACSRKARPADCPKGGQRLGVRADIVKDDQGKYRVQFRLYDKAEARRAVVQRYGPDPEKWPYFAKRKQLREGTADAHV